MKLKLIMGFIIYGACAMAQPAKNKSYYDEPFRPQFHFTPPSKWMNDPNGLVYHKGKYHLFYQYFPNDIVWGPMHWGHAISSDLLHWKHLPIALYPDSLGWIFSGSAVIDHKNTAGFGTNAMVAIFTYHNDEIWKKGMKNTESQGLAYSTDEGNTWIKYKGNPVLNNSGEQDFRDPKVSWNEQSGKWNMVLAVGDRIRIFSSPNLKTWTFESDFKPNTDDTQLGVWECPDLMKFSVKDSKEEKWVMIVNHGDKAPNGGSGTRYFVGDFNGKTFTNTQPAIWLDAGTDFYAAVGFGNVPGNKKILLAWMSNWQYATKTPTEAWRSAMTLPRELNLVKDGVGYRLKQQIVQQFQAISKPVWHEKRQVLPLKKSGVGLEQSDISFDLDNNTRHLVIEFSNLAGERFTIELSNGQLTTDRSASGITGFSETFVSKKQVMPLQGTKIDHVQLVTDRSSVEILLNHGLFSMTNCYFPKQAYTVLSIRSDDAGSITNLDVKAVERVW